MEFSKVYLKENFLFEENFFMIEKINIKSIDDIMIFHYTPGGNHRFYMFLDQPIQYEVKRNSFVNKVLFFVYKNSIQTLTKLKKYMNTEGWKKYYRLLKKMLKIQCFL